MNSWIYRKSCAEKSLAYLTVTTKLHKRDMLGLEQHKEISSTGVLIGNRVSKIIVERILL